MILSIKINKLGITRKGVKIMHVWVIGFYNINNDLHFKWLDKETSKQSLI